MIRTRSYIPMNQNRQELTEKGLELFGCAVNDDDVHRYRSDLSPLHWHRELEVFRMISGAVRMDVGDRSQVLHAGEGCLINSGVLHSFTAQTAGECHFRSFVFDAAILAGAPDSVFDTRYVRPFLAEGAPYVAFSGEDEAFSGAFNRAFSACKIEKTGYEFAVRDALSQILLLAGGKTAETVPAAPAAQQEERMKALLAWIDGHLESEITMAELARAAQVCPRVCQRLFQRYLHCRPMEYCMHRRIMAAAWMLSATDETITNIAVRYAFANPSHFSRQFRRATGCTPSEYRQRARRT